VYLAGTFVNLGNTKLDAWDAAGAAESYASAIARLHAARDAGSRVGALAPFLANAERGAAAAAKLAGLARPRIGMSSIAAPPRTDAMTSASLRAYIGRPAAALADANVQGELEALRLRAMAKGGFLAAGPERVPWDWDEHDETIDCFDAAIELAPDDLELRRFKARALFRAASVGQASTRAFVAARDKYAPDVFEELLAVPRRRYTGGAARTSDAYAQALRLAPDDASLHAERDEDLRDFA
jgi:tetratricopeptide (TPR) repeat protein